MIGRMLSSCAAAGALLLALSSGNIALAQKSGGILKIQHWDSPASMSIHEEATYSTVLPIMGVMNNLVLYKQDVPQNSLQTVAPAQMRQHPIGTGPFKFVEFKPNEHIKVARNPDYWKPGRPYLDGIEYTIVPNRSTAILGFVAGQFDVTWPFSISVPLLKDTRSQAPQAICELRTTNGTTNLLVNRDAPPFDNPEIRRAMALALDRKAFIDIISGGEGKIGGAMLPPPEGQWGMPPDMLQTLPGYG